jgi:hypothetical protein
LLLDLLIVFLQLFKASFPFFLLLLQMKVIGSFSGLFDWLFDTVTSFVGVERPHVLRQKVNV